MLEFIGRCSITGILTAVSVGAVAAQPALETPEGYGTRPITMIVPFGSGGGSDQLARAMSEAMNEVGGLTFQVVNRPGGGGVAAIPDFMVAPADGYTILENIDTVVSAYAKGDIKENPASDWIPICTTQITFSQLYIRPDEERFTDWESLVDHIEESDSKLTIANLGQVGSMELVLMDQLQSELGLEFRQVAYDKPSERYGALLGGHVDLLFEQPGDVRNFIDAEQMKPILTFLNERPGVFSEVPTHREVGADFEALTRFRNFYVRNGVPEDRVAFLEQVCEQAFQTEGYQAFNADKYMDLIDSYRGRQATVDLINATAETYRAIYRETGLIE